MRSNVTNKLIMFGACETHNDQENPKEHSPNVNNIHANVNIGETLANS